MAPPDPCSGCSTYSSEELARFLSGDLSPRRTRDLLRHLPQCAICRQRLRELEAVRAVLRQAPPPPLPRSFALAPADMRRRRLWYPLLRGATTAMAAVVLAVFAFSLLLPPTYETRSPTAILVGAETPSPDTCVPATVVGPAITRRTPPTSGPGLVTPLPAYTTATAYPPPSPLSPRSLATSSSGLQVAPTGPATPEGVSDFSFLTLLRLGGLLFLGLMAGLTWLAYRRERVFLS